MASKELAEALAKFEGRPWPTWDHPRPITPHALARLLAPFDISPRNLCIGRSVVKGYQRSVSETRGITTCLPCSFQYRVPHALHRYKPRQRGLMWNSASNCLSPM